MAAANTDKLRKLSRKWVGQIGAAGVADASTTTIPLASTTNLATDTAVTLVIDRVDSSGTKTPSLEETIVGVVSGSNIVNAVRGVEGTAQAHLAGAVVEVLVTADGYNDIIDHLLVAHLQSGAHAGSSISASMIAASGVIPGNLAASSVLSGNLAASSVLSGNLAASAVVSGNIAASAIVLGNLAASSVSQGNLNFTTGSTDGWITSTDTWTYASASSFTISGVDRTTTFTPGTKLKFTQTTAKYAVVSSSSFSTNTTVNIIVNTDYTIANAAITSPFYSYEEGPQAFPGWFTYAPTRTGWSSSTGTAQYNVQGRTVTVFTTENFGGTSNATTKTITLPVTAAAMGGTDRSWLSGPVQDNTSWQTLPGHIRLESTDLTLVKLGKTAHVAAWTGSGTATFSVFFSYQI